MQRYFMRLAYVGTAYKGWQEQPDAPSVQACISDCLSTLIGKQTPVVGAGRTDAGVHAKEMILHFDAEHLPEKLIYRLNRFLPRDIQVYDVWEVPAEAHARFDATARQYQYIVAKGKQIFWEGRAWQLYQPLDIQAMNAAESILLGKQDFSSFAKIHTDVKTHICTLEKAVWTEYEDHYCFEVHADRFLRNMVRAMVGTLVQVGTGNLALNEFKAILEAKDRGAAAASAPAEGLYLTRVIYPEHLKHVTN